VTILLLLGLGTMMLRQLERKGLLPATPTPPGTRGHRRVR
jgi:hypothetical protein